MNATVEFKILSEAAGQSRYVYRGGQVIVPPSFFFVLGEKKGLFESYVLLCEQAQQLDLFESPIRHEAIQQADIPPGEQYRVIEPLKVLVERLSSTEFVAKLKDANLAIGGSTYHEAYRNLINEILDAFDFLRANELNLSDDLKNQLTLLRRHLVPVNN